MSVIYDNITNILNYILKYVTKLAIFIDKRHLPSCQNKFVKKATIYNSGPPRNSSLSTKVKRFAIKACLRVHGRRPLCSSRQCKSPPSSVKVLSEGR